MRIATYNIWNSETNFALRLEMLVKLINENNIDVIGFQEVPNETTVDYIKTNCGFKYSCWKKYYDCEEGLAVLSRFPIIMHGTNWESQDDIHNSGVMRTSIAYEGF